LTEPVTVERDGHVLLIGINRAAKRNAFNLAAHVERARELAHLIARQAPLGVQATLASARAGLGSGPDSARVCIASLMPGILRSQDAAEGLRSFTERREAHFTGH